MASKGSGKGSGTKGGKGAPGKVAMTQERASAIQSHTMKTTGTVKASDFAARAMRAAANNVNQGVVTATAGKK